MIPNSRDLAFVTMLAAAFATAAWGVTAYAGRSRPPAYRATVTWIVETRPGAAGAEPRAYAEALVEDEFLRTAMDALGEANTAEGVAALRSELEVDVVGSLLRLRLRAPTAEGAERRAEALATAVETWAATARAGEAERLAAGGEDLAARRESLDAEIDAVEDRVRTLQVLDASEYAEEIADLLAERETLLDRREALDAGSNGAGASPGLVHEGLDVEAVPPEPSPVVVPAVAFAAVLGGGLGAAILAARRRGAGGPAPGGSDEKGVFSDVLATWEVQDPADSAGTDAAATALHVALLETLPDAWPRVVLLAGVERSDDVARVAARLAEEVARGGARVLLVDADLAAPSLSTRYAIGADDAPASSTSDWLMRPEDDHRVLSVDVGHGASLDLVPQVRPTRPAPDFVEEVFAGFPRVLRRWWQTYDVIVVRAAPVTEGAETLLLAPHVTGVALVVDDGADRRAWRRARRDLQRTGARLAGFVVVPRRTGRGASVSRPDARAQGDGSG